MSCRIGLVLFFVGAIFFSVTPAAEPQKASTIYFAYVEGSFSATGNWAPADPKDKPALPSETEIDCFKNSRSCVEGRAEAYFGHPHITLNFYEVIKWDGNGIIARDSSGTCMTVTIQITYAEKRISSTHSMKTLDDEAKRACNFFGADETQEDIFVLKGSERWNKEHSLLPQKTEK